MKNISVYISANFRPKGYYQNEKVGTGAFKKTLFGEKEIVENRKGFVQTGWSDNEIDIQRLNYDLLKELSRLNVEGYEVVEIVPIASGRYNSEKGMTINGGGFGYAYGFSYTEGLLVIAKK